MAKVPCMYAMMLDDATSNYQYIHRLYYVPETGKWTPSEVWYSARVQFANNWGFGSVSVRTPSQNLFLLAYPRTDDNGLTVDVTTAYPWVTFFAYKTALSDLWTIDLNYASQNPGSYGPPYPYNNTGSGRQYYLMGLKYGPTGPPYDFYLAAYGSADLQTWVNLDTSAEKHFVYPFTDGQASWTQSNFDNKMFVAYQSGGLVRLIWFDCATETWNSDTATFPAPASTVGHVGAPLKRPDGSMVFFHTDLISGNSAVVLRVLDILGGTWGSQVQVSTYPFSARDITFGDAIMDDSGNLHLTYSYTDNTFAQRIAYRRYSSSNVLSTEIIFDSVGDRPSNILIYDNQAWICFDLSNFSGEPAWGLSYMKSSNLTPNATTDWTSHRVEQPNQAYPYEAYLLSTILSEPPCSCPPVTPAAKYGIIV